MKLDRVPRGILVALGLSGAAVAEEGCVSTCLDVGPETDSVNACLSPPHEPTTSGGSGSATSTSGPSTGGSDSDTGGSEETSPPEGSTSVGPCLSPPPDDTTGLGSDSGSDSGSGSESGSGSSGGGAAAPEHPDAVIDRVLSTGALPADVADRVRRRGR